MHAQDETMLHACIQGLRAPLWWPLVVSYSSATTTSPFKATWLSLKTQLKCCKLASMLVLLKVAASFVMSQPAVDNTWEKDACSLLRHREWKLQLCQNGTVTRLSKYVTAQFTTSIHTVSCRLSPPRTMPVICAAAPPLTGAGGSPVYCTPSSWTS